jgi:hypothetical protein
MSLYGHCAESQEACCIVGASGDSVSPSWCAPFFLFVTGTANSASTWTAVHLLARTVPLRLGSDTTPSVSARPASIWAAPFRVLKLARLRANVQTNPSSVDSHQALFTALLDSNSVQDAQEVIEQFETSSGLFAARQPGEQIGEDHLLRDDKLFDLYLNALALAGRAGAGEKLVSAAARRDALLSGQEVAPVQDVSASEPSATADIPPSEVLAKAVVDRGIKPGAASRVAGGSAKAGGAGDGQPIRVIVEEGLSDVYECLESRA